MVHRYAPMVRYQQLILIVPAGQTVRVRSNDSRDGICNENGRLIGCITVPPDVRQGTGISLIPYLLWGGYNLLYNIGLNANANHPTVNNAN